MTSLFVGNTSETKNIHSLLVPLSEQLRGLSHLDQKAKRLKKIKLQFLLQQTQTQPSQNLEHTKTNTILKKEKNHKEIRSLNLVGLCASGSESFCDLDFEVMLVQTKQFFVFVQLLSIPPHWRIVFIVQRRQELTHKRSRLDFPLLD